MGNSSESKLWQSSKQGSSFCYEMCQHCNRIAVNQLILWCEKGTVNLSAFIHEVNECEIVHLLAEMIPDYNHSKQIIKFDGKLREKYKNFMETKRHAPEDPDKNEGVLVSHIMSPYGCCDCVYPNYKYRARW